MAKKPAFVLREFLNVGTTHPVVARLSVQTSDVVHWLDVDKATKDSILELYTMTLTPRLVGCHDHYDELVAKMREQDAAISRGLPAGFMPNIMGLRRSCESFLYEAKNYIRDLIGILHLIYGCPLKDASDLGDLKNKGQSEVVKWANGTLGPNHRLTKMLTHEAPWTTELIRKRNAVEHPGGYSGELFITSIERHPAVAGKFTPPTWRRSGEPESDILSDMNVSLQNMLTLAEDLVAGAMLDKPTFAGVTIYEIAPEDRKSDCPIRLRVNLNPEMMEKLKEAMVKDEATAKAKDHLPGKVREGE